MRQLGRHEYELVIPIFRTVEYYSPVAFSVIEGKQPGAIFVNDEDSVAQAFVCGGGNYNYLAGSPNNPSFNNALRQLLWQGNRAPCELCIHPQEWSACIDELLGDSAQKLPIKTFRIRVDRFENNRGWPSRIPESCRVLRIEEALYGRIVESFWSFLSHLWPEKEAFVSEGLGYSLLYGDQIASICLSSFVGGGACDISLITAQEFRGRGYASLTAAAFIDGWLQKGLSPQWHTTPDNAASIAIAKKMGFEETGEFTMYEVAAANSEEGL